ncbi:DUF51 family protein [Babesia caballi]|uniref:DUF51 family protein n=1 Tax=Babesia caballi TaxID=5871 RepID=A0AAV4LZ98_BABCB|nr:DUF51 family protein [Babesia caballi]
MRVSAGASVLSRKSPLHDSVGRPFCCSKCSGRYAELSAFDDDRFNPVTDEEVPRLICAVSLLHSYEDAADLHDWEIGKHGVQVTFDVKGEEYSSTYLPEVAEEHNLTKDVAIRQLIRKAGYRGPINDKLMALIKVTRYQSKKFRMTYEEYTLLGEEAESEQ